MRERLRALIRRIEQRPPRRAPAPPPRAPSLPGTEPRQTSAGECLYREVRYGFDDAFGAQPLGALTQLDEDALALLAPAENFGGVRLEDLLFIDIETTGLGGAGAAAFLVAAARVEPDAGGPALVLRQYIAPAPGAEAALLTALLADAPPSGDPVLVTYNGRALRRPRARRAADDAPPPRQLRGAASRRPAPARPLDLPLAALATPRLHRGRGARLHAAER